MNFGTTQEEIQYIANSSTDKEDFMRKFNDVEFYYKPCVDVVFCGKKWEGAFMVHSTVKYGEVIHGSF